MKYKQLISSISKNANRTLSMTGLKLKKYSPEILIGLGIVTGIGTVITACTGTLKAQEVLAEAKENIAAIHTVAETPELAEQYSEEDKKRDLIIAYSRAGFGLLRVYAPAFILGTLSVACTLGSHNIMKRRNAALAAAYAVVEKGFKEYRGRVVERFGEEIDKELKYGLKAKEIEETVINEKTGKEKTVKKSVMTADKTVGYSPYAVMWDCGNKGWQKSANARAMYIRSQQNYCNDLLRSKGYLFLNDVYEILGYPLTQDGQHMGWILERDEAKATGDNYIDFGAYEVRSDDGNTGYVLDFNIDGNIWAIMEDPTYRLKFNTWGIVA